jgi:hypothetical protein
VQGHLKMVSFTCEEALAMVFYDSGSELSEESVESDESSDDDNATGDTTDSSTNNPDPTNIHWESYSYLDPFESNWLCKYKEKPAILIETTDFEPVDYFHAFFPEDAFKRIAEETNRYADQFFDTPVEFSPPSRFHAWSDTSVDEIKAFVALQIAMGLWNKPAISDYWNSYWLTTINFGDVMTRNRFELLQTFLHFINTANQVPRDEEGYNPLFKIQPLLDICNPTYKKVYTPKKCLAIDEIMIKLKGRIFFRQYLPKKPTKWGIKAFLLCESESGYCLKSHIYTGKGSFQRSGDDLLSDHVVLGLLDGYENKGHVVFMDNFYSSPNLFAKLELKHIGACGTVKGNRQKMPKVLLQKRG